MLVNELLVKFCMLHVSGHRWISKAVNLPRMRPPSSCSCIPLSVSIVCSRLLNLATYTTRLKMVDCMKSGYGQHRYYMLHTRQCMHACSLALPTLPAFCSLSSTTSSKFSRVCVPNSLGRSLSCVIACAVSYADEACCWWGE